jgi:membrane associated rhomboid family serine protease
MVIPLYDHNPFRFTSPPYATWTLLAANLIFFAIVFLGAATSPVVGFAETLGLTPSPAASGEAPPALPWALTFVTYTFVHANWLHVVGNMLFLWVFGDDIEEALGHARFVLFYLLCGAGGGLAYYLTGPGSHTPLIGASGAVAGIIAAYLILRPCQKIWVLLFARIPVKISAYWALGFWIAMQIASAVVDPHSEISWSAHLGGVAAGALLVIVLRRPGVKLFDCPPELAPIADAVASDRDARAR